MKLCFLLQNHTAQKHVPWQNVFTFSLSLPRIGSWYCCSKVCFESTPNPPPPRGGCPCTAVLTRRVWRPRTPVHRSPTWRQPAWRATGCCCSLMSSVWWRSQRADDASWGKLSCAGAGDGVAAAPSHATAGLTPGEPPSPREHTGMSPSWRWTFISATPPQRQV